MSICLLEYKHPPSASSKIPPPVGASPLYLSAPYQHVACELQSIPGLWPIPFLLILAMLRPFADGEPKKSDDFLKFPQYEEFSVYVFVKAGSSYCLLKRIKAEIDRREVLYSRRTRSSRG